MRTISAAFTVMLLLASAAVAQDVERIEQAGEIDEVTLFRGQALVTRQVKIEVSRGLTELWVSDLPVEVVGDSLFAEGEGVQVRAVRYRTRAVGEAPRKEIREIEEQIDEVQDKLIRVGSNKRLVESRLAYLDKLENFVATRGKGQLGEGKLDAGELQEITKFTFAEREKASKEHLELSFDERKLKKELELLVRKKNELASGSSRTVREAVVFLEASKAGDATVRLSYLVNRASWVPHYNLRAERNGEVVEVEYNAIIQQMSGEDWRDVELTLSTASPALSAQGPGLAPFRVTLGGHQNQLGKDQVAAVYQSIEGRRRQAEQQQLQAQEAEGNTEYAWAMNSAANEAQNLELNATRDALLALKMRRPAADEGPSVTYSLDGTVSLQSRSDQQMVGIADVKLPSRFYYVAVPVLTSFVYREAELTNNAVEALLAGQVSVYLDGRFVGRGEIPTVAQGQTFVMGFGVDSQLRSRRELVKRTEQVQGGNKEIRFDYRLVIENFKEEAVKVRVFDRMPVAHGGADIQVTLLEMSDELSKDELYLRTERPKGILRWDLEVAGGSSNSQARLVEYGYKLEFDRNLALAAPGQAGPQAEALKQEFERQMRKNRIR